MTAYSSVRGPRPLVLLLVAIALAGAFSAALAASAGPLSTATAGEPRDLSALYRTAEGRFDLKAYQRDILGGQFHGPAAPDGQSDAPDQIPIPELPSVPDDQYWWDQFGQGFDGNVYASLAYNGDLIVAGDFLQAGNVEASHIARWDGVRWHALGQGTNNTIVSLAVYGGRLIAGGVFTQAGGLPASRIAAWDGQSWSALGSGLNGSALAVTAFASNLYAGGTFSQAGGQPASRVARWNGSSWSAMNTGMDGPVFAMTMYQGAPVAGGDFHTAGGVACESLARWTGSAWQPIGQGPHYPYGGDVMALAVDGTDLIAGGWFPQLGHIARWNGSSWTPLGSGVGYEIYSVLPWDGGIVVGGAFTDAGGNDARYVAQFNGTDWLSMEIGTSAPVKTLISYDGLLFAGGLFEMAGFEPARHFAAWDGTYWTTYGAGVDYAVSAMGEYDNQLIAAGAFARAGSTQANNIAAWNGQTWDTLGEGLNGGYAYCLGTYQGDLIVGGDFSEAGGQPASYIARWDGAQWHPLGDGIFVPGGGGYVQCVVEWNGDLIAGGYFTLAGGQESLFIARWDGQSWHPLGSGMNGGVWGLAVYEGALIAGGYFTQAGGQPCDFVARWNGSSWTPVGSGLNEGVATLKVFQGSLVAGGEFTAIAGLPARCMARLNGAQWVPMGIGMDGYGWGVPYVYALEEYDGALIAAGSFVTADGAPASNIARWNGNGWDPLGSGLTGPDPQYYTAWCVQQYQVSLFAGGRFTHAGAKSNLSIAQWSNLNPSDVAGSVGSGADGTGAAVRGGGLSHKLSCYPNPAGPVTTLRFTLPRDTHARLTVIDPAGREVALVQSSSMTEGRHEVLWNRRNGGEKPVPAGIYFVRLEAGGMTSVRKLVLY